MLFGLPFEWREPALFLKTEVKKHVVYLYFLTLATKLLEFMGTGRATSSSRGADVVDLDTKLPRYIFQFNYS